MGWSKWAWIQTHPTMYVADPPARRAILTEDFVQHAGPGLRLQPELLGYEILSAPRRRNRRRKCAARPYLEYILTICPQSVPLSLWKIWPFNGSCGSDNTFEEYAFANINSRKVLRKTRSQTVRLCPLTIPPVHSRSLARMLTGSPDDATSMLPIWSVCLPVTSS